MATARRQPLQVILLIFLAASGTFNEVGLASKVNFDYRSALASAGHLHIDEVDNAASTFRRSEIMLSRVARLCLESHDEVSYSGGKHITMWISSFIATPVIMMIWTVIGLSVSMLMFSLAAFVYAICVFIPYIYGTTLASESPNTILFDAHHQYQLPCSFSPLLKS